MYYNSTFTENIGTEVGLTEKYYKVPGIITATKANDD